MFSKLLTAFFLLSVISAQGVYSETGDGEICPRKSIGRLGKQLGVRQIITGELAQNVMIGNALRVSAEGEVSSNKSIAIEVRGQTIAKGKKYKFEGYESGEFSGPPEWASKEAVQQPFQFKSFFVVTKVLEIRSIK